MSKKIVALLEITGNYTAGARYIPCLNYFWSLYPNFITFEIIDNKNDITYYNQLLDEYYLKGFRIFFGPISSTMLVGILDWFINHPDAICVPPIVSSPITLPKNVFRPYPGDYYYLNYIKQANPLTTRVFYFYNPNQVTCTKLLLKLQTETLFSTILEYPVLNDSELTISAVEGFFETNNITTNDIIIAFLLNGNNRVTYFNLFESINIGNVKQYDVRPLGLPDVSNTVSNLYDNYFCIINNSLNTTGIYEEALVTLDEFKTPYALNTLSSLYLLELFSNNTSLDNAFSYGELVPWFDDNNGLKYWSYVVYVYNSTGFNKTNIYLNDPTYGIITFNKK